MSANVHYFLITTKKTLHRLAKLLSQGVFSIMQKTKKSIAKRFKVTGSGKVLRRTAGFRHFLRHKTVKQRRDAHHDQAVSPGFSKQILKAISVGL